MKFTFEIDELEDPHKVRAMLMRGYHAFLAEKAEYQKDHDLAILGPETLFKLMAEPEVIQGRLRDRERFAAEERAWNELLLSFTEVDRG